MPDDKPAPYRIVERFAGDGADEREQVIAGLLAQPPGIAPKYFYDELGCALYAAICKLPEYYPTRTEAALFEAHRGEIARQVSAAPQLVDLGAGDCLKAQAWLPFLEASRYIAVDIAAAELERALARMAPEFADTEMIGVIADFNVGLPLEGVLDEGAATFFYPGSSIGNFSPGEAVRFLSRIQALCASRPGSGLLIGVDSKKDKALLDAAYDDALGVTAAFNLNVLRHLNRRFGFDFRAEGFAHRGFYNEAAGRIEMHLESRVDQSVTMGAVQRRFECGESIHTENSYKYAAAEFEALLGAAGFAAIRHWAAPAQGYFAFYAR